MTLRSHGVPRALVLLAGLLVCLALPACSEDPKKVAAEALASGNKHFDAKEYAEAVIEYKRGTIADPMAGEIRYKLAQTYILLGDHPNALQESTRAADLLPNDLNAQLLAARLLLVGNAFEDAKTRALMAVKIDSKSPDAQILLGNALAGLKDLPSAIKTVTDAVGLNEGYGLTYVNLGTMQLRAGDKVAAENAFKRAVAVDPNSESAHLALANFYWAYGNLAGAEEHLKEAARLSPSSQLANRAIATFYLQNKQLDKAEQYLKAYVATANDPEGRLALADFYWAAGKRDQARPILEELAKQPVFFSRATTRLASIDYAEGKKDKVNQQLDAVLARSPKDFDARMMKVRLLRDQGKPGDALTAANALVADYPNAALALYAQGAMLAATNAPADAIKSYLEALRHDSTLLSAQLEVARLSLTIGDAKQAQEYADQVIRLQPAAADAHLILGRALAQLGQHDQALRELVPLARAVPKSSAVHNALGLAYAGKKDYANARKEYNAALALMPDSIEAIAGLTNLDVAEGKAADARARLEGRLKSHPDDVKAQILAGETYSSIGDASAAEAAFKRAIQIDSSQLEAYGALARIYVRQNRLDDAAREFQEIATRRPADVGVRTMIGMIYTLKNQPDEARKHYEAALAINPHTPVAANNLAQYYADRGENLDTALQLAQTAKMGLPDRPEIDDTLGWVFYKKKQAALAINAFKRCVDAKPDNPTYLAHLGLAYAQNQNRELARQSLRKALAMRPDFDGAADARDALKSLGG